MANNTDITVLVLAGGAGRRVGGQDKGLTEWRGKALVAHVLDSVASSADRVIVSCNRNLERYADYTDTLVCDLRGDFQGPLAGLEAARPLVSSSLLLVVACDTPLLPKNLVEDLQGPIAAGRADISYAHDGERAHYLCALLRQEVLLDVEEFLDRGGRAVKDWYRQHRSEGVDFSGQRECFRNFNRLTTTETQG